MNEPFEDDFRALDLVRLLNQANGEGATLTTLRDLVEMACEHGACRALRRCGLEDHGAGQDFAGSLAGHAPNHASHSGEMDNQFDHFPVVAGTGDQATSVAIRINHFNNIQDV